MDKIEEYRASEDAMRLTLLCAQKLSAQIEAEARARAEKTLAEAEAAASRSGLEALRSETAREQPAPQRGEGRRSQRFFEEARALCSRQLDYLERGSLPRCPCRGTSASRGRGGEEHRGLRRPNTGRARAADRHRPRAGLRRQQTPADDVTHLFSLGGQG